MIVDFTLNWHVFNTTCLLYYVQLSIDLFYMVTPKNADIFVHILILYTEKWNLSELSGVDFSIVLITLSNFI